MNPIIISNETRYCDWRFTVQDCEASDFLYRVALVPVVGMSLQAFCLLLLFVNRVFLFKESWHSFTTGENGLIVTFSCTSTVWFIQCCLVVAGNSSASEVLWVIMNPMAFFPLVFYLSSLIQAFPKSMIPADNHTLKILVKKVNLRRSICVGFCFFMFFLNVILYTVAWTTENAQLSMKLKQAALASMGINVFILTILFVFVSLHFRTLLASLVAAMKEIGKEKFLSEEENERMKSMEENVKKIQATIGSMAIESAMNMTYHLLLAFYSDFFINMPFTMAMTIIYTAILSISNVPTALYYVYADFLRLRRKFWGSTYLSNDSGHHNNKPRESSQRVEEIGDVAMSA